MKLLLTILFFGQGLFANTMLKIEDLKPLVLKQSPSVRSQALSVESAEAKNRSVYSSLLPEVNLFAYQEEFKVGREDKDKGAGYGAEAKINIFNSAKDKFAASSSNYLLQSEKFKFKDHLQNELFELADLYWQIVFLEKKLEIHEQELQQNEAVKASAQKRINAGIATKTDRFEFDMYEHTLKQEVLKEKEDLIYLKKKIAQKLELNPSNLKLASKLDQNIEAPGKNVAKIKSFASLSSYSEFQSAQSLKSQKTMWWAPSLDLYASYNQFNRREEDFADSLDRREQVLGIRLEIPLFDKGVALSERRALAADSARLELQAKIEQEIFSDEYNYLNNKLEATYRALQLSAENSVLSQKYIEAIRSEYQRGVKNSLDVMGATQKAFSIRLADLENQKEYQILKYRLNTLNEQNGDL